MRPRSERVLGTASAQAPHDLVDYNDRLMCRAANPHDAELYLKSHFDSWDGVEGPFRDSLVAVASPFVAGSENLPQTNRGNAVVPMIGRLGTVEVVKLDYKLPLFGRWESYVVAATLEPASRHTDKGIAVKENSLVILSFPPQQGYRRVRFNRTD